MSTDRVLLQIVERDARRREALLAKARHRGFRRFLAVRTEGRSGEEWVSDRGDRLVGGPGARFREHRVVSVGSASELEKARRHLRAGEAIAVRWTAERVLPLETLVAEGASPERLWVFAGSPEELPAALGALEHGAGSAIIQLTESAVLDRIEEALESGPGLSLRWEPVRVTRALPAGVGERVIVDTTSLLTPEEGLLVGSVAAYLFHVRSEAIGSRFTRPRPFRVNAGAPHSYVLLASGETRYLSELEAGDRVAVAAPRAPPRTVRVGRLKIERRPLSMIEAKLGERRVTLFAQEAETVRLSGPRGGRAVTELRTGERLLGVRLPESRHLGVAVAMRVEER